MTAARPTLALAFRRIKSIIPSIMPAASIHGHAVIDMVAEAGSAFTRRELVAAIEARFGAEARFHTRADEGGCVHSGWCCSCPGSTRARTRA